MEAIASRRIAPEPPDSALPSAPGATAVPPLDPRTLHAYRRHVRDRIDRCRVGTQPFRHMFVDEVLPAELYEALRARMVACKYGGQLQERRQDSTEYVNHRFSLVDNQELEIAYLRTIFSDPELKEALLGKFYLEPSRALADALQIHDEFEFVHCAAGRFQTIHLDIPPKFLSFVFYLPEHPVGRAEEERNATVMYDRELRPHHHARYEPNSLCIFAPHFHSYHGFASTIARDVLVMFYVDEEHRRRWAVARARDEPPYTALLDAIEQKLRTHPLIEYGRDEERLALERARCLVNAPKGRVVQDAAGRPLPRPETRAARAEPAPVDPLAPPSALPAAAGPERGGS